VGGRAGARWPPEEVYLLIARKGYAGHNARYANWAHRQKNQLHGSNITSNEPPSWPFPFLTIELVGEESYGHGPVHHLT